VERIELYFFAAILYSCYYCSKSGTIYLNKYSDANPKLIKQFILQKFTCKIYVADDKRVSQLKHKKH